VLSHAVEAPASLSAFAVREIEKAILTGRRDALGGADHEPGIVTARMSKRCGWSLSRRHGAIRCM